MENNGISTIDLGIVIILFVFLIYGYKRGFTVEIMRIIGTMVALMASTKLMSNVSGYLIQLEIPPIASSIISFITIFAAVVLGFKYLSTHLKKAISFSVILGGADKLVGGVLGLLKGSIVVSLITILISVFSFSDVINRHIIQSQLFNPMRRVAPLVYDAFKVLVPGKQPFVYEFEENFSKISYDKRGDSVNSLIRFYSRK